MAPQVTGTQPLPTLSGVQATARAGLTDFPCASRTSASAVMKLSAQAATSCC